MNQEARATPDSAESRQQPLQTDEEASVVCTEETGCRRFDDIQVRHDLAIDRALLSYRAAKRVFDIVMSGVGLIIFLPLYVVIALAILITSGWPVLFKQARVGRHGRIFHVFKFRTMVNNAEEVLKANTELYELYKKNFDLAHDPRITKIGYFLRRTSLDELPQLMNVLIGDMSLVGPRPLIPSNVEMLDKYGPYRYVYTHMKPGCAGLWQCCGRSDLSNEEKVQLDFEYHKRASFLFDIEVLAKTIWAIVCQRGAR